MRKYARWYSWKAIHFVNRIDKGLEQKMQKLRDEIKDSECPICGATLIYKDTFTNTRGENVDRYECKKHGIYTPFYLREL